MPARFSRTVAYGLLIGVDYKRSQRACKEQRAALLAATHQRSAERVLHVCQLHGGLYTKLGQFLASMSHAL